MQSHLSMLSLNFWAIGILFRKSLPMPICSNVFPTFSYSRFKVSGLTGRSFIHFELILVQGEKHGGSFSFLHASIHFSQQHLLKRLLFLCCNVLGSFIKNQVAVATIHCNFYKALFR
jgi:hypothetical protein